MVGVLKVLLKLYKLFLSPFLGTRCRFHPTCSVYCVEAIEKKGLSYGTFLALKRIVRCNPWYSGKDHVLE
ncbi:MAG TPA: membrane protein insertion efficiency factor YidD [Oligoflexia bacterium]|nr:membrane protein insertion efficiency factor YidD [Oligoflexia bacterium]